jgi:Ca-activated chloride channel family protein
MTNPRRKLAVLAAVGVIAGAAGVAAAAPVGRKITQGTLQAFGKEHKPLGDCPLKHTDVTVSISSHVAYVSVRQVFTNPFPDKIEAVYTFPMSSRAAVSEMMMKVGDRLILGKIKRREEARRIYEEAKAAGHVASLLDQERPNIFTQAVANIEPGKTVEVTIGYSETLKYEEGTYRFVFPMVVGPRFIPSAPPPPTPVRPVPRRGGAVPAPAAVRPAAVRPAPAPGVPAVPDADKITPPVTPKDTRAGHDIAIHGWIDAGLAIRSVTSRLHEVSVKYKNAARTRAGFELASKKTLPNKDFVLEFSTASDEIADATLTHTDRRGGYFLLTLQPPKKVHPKQVRPRELIFVVDISGSQKGFPLETSKAILERVLKELRADDTFNVISFENKTAFCWEKPVANTQENREKALAFVRGLAARGGTRIDKALTAALEGEHDAGKVRLVAVFTDGLIGHDLTVLDQVKKNAGTSRVFVYGTGNSANRFLLDHMARFGRGAVEYALRKEEAPRVAQTFYSRIDAPVLTDIEIDWGDLAPAIETDEVYPKRPADLFSVQPVVVQGRYKPGRRGAKGTITIRGRTGEGAFARKVEVELPGEETANAVLAQQWARAKVEELMAQDLTGIQTGKPDAAIKERIVGLGLNYRLMTQYTSFVAVEAKTVTVGGEARKVEVPVEMPEGMSYEGVFGPRVSRGGRALGTLARGRRASSSCLRASRPANQGAATLGLSYQPSAKPKRAPGAVPIRLVLPKPRFSGTPKNVPPGTRVRIQKGPYKPRPPFFAPKGTTNVALKKPVTSSDPSPAVGTLGLVTDGNKEASEDAYVELRPDVQWVQIDLKGNHKIHAVVVWHEHKSAIVYRDVIVQVADDKDFTQNVRTLYNNDHDNSAGRGSGKEWGYFETNEGLLVDAKGVKARYVRLYSKGNNGDDLNRYTEVEVYAVAAK